MKTIPKLLLITLFLFPFQALAAKDIFFDYEPAIINAFQKGDDPALYESIKKFLTEQPESLFAPLFFNDLKELAETEGYTEIESIIRKLISLVEKKEPDNFPALKLLLKLELEELYYRYNPEKAVRITSELNPVRSWRLEGPFKKYGAADTDHEFPPEIVPDGPETPSKKIFLENSDGVLRIDRYIFPVHGTVYASTSFRAERPVKIRIYCNAEYRLFINGGKIIENRAEIFSGLRIIKLHDAQDVSLVFKTSAPENTDWNLRVIVTGHDDRAVAYTHQSRKPGYKVINGYSEVTHFPIEQLIRYAEDKPSYAAETYFYLANYLSVSGIAGAGRFYEKSLEIEEDLNTKYFHALHLMKKNEKGSPLYTRGHSIINEIVSADTGHIPALNRYFYYYFDNNDLSGAYMRAAATLEKAPLSSAANSNFISLLMKMDYDHEASTRISSYKKFFPESSWPSILEARFFRNININKHIDLSRQILNRHYNKEVCENLLKAYMRTGRYDEAVKLGEKYNHNESYTDYIIEAYIQKGDHSSADRLIMKEIARSGLPSHYLTRAAVDRLAGRDYIFNLETAGALNPSAFGLADYVDYSLSGEYRNLFPGFDAENPRELLKPGQEELSSVVLSSKKYFYLFDHGANRLYAEKTVYIGDSRGSNRWSDYKIPFKGRLYPVHAATYSPDGEVLSSYSIQRINGEYHINFMSTEPGSILRIAYIIDNPVSTMSGSGFFASPLIPVQNHEEPCNLFEIKITAPDKMPLDFRYSGDPVKHIETADGKKVYSFRFADLTSAAPESFSGSSFFSLPFFAFSGMKILDDFSVWYNGLLPPMITGDLIPAGEIKGESVRESVSNVYDYINREIDHAAGPVYNPAEPGKTLLARKGTSEDRVILMKAVLEKLGISSHIAFASKISLPDRKSFVSPSLFSDILLYVPEDENGIWIDLSGRYYPAGITNGELNGMTAVVLTDNGYFKKEISSAPGTLKKSRYQIKLNRDGNAGSSFSAEFSGRYSEIKQYFRYGRYHEERINTYFSSIVSPFIIRNYSVLNHRPGTESLKISAEGCVPGFAIAAENMLIFQPVINKSTVYRYLETAERKLPLIIHADIIEHEEYVYCVPEGFTPGDIEGADEIKSPFGSAGITTTWNSEKNEIRITKELKIKSGRIEPEDYPGFFEFCMKLRRLEERVLTLKSG